MYNFRNFAADLEQIVSSAHSNMDIIRLGAGALRNLLNNNNLFSNEYINGLLDGTEDATVYHSQDNNFIIQVFTWEKNSQTPIHDHETWGIMGIYHNQLQVSEYQLVETSRPGNYDLNETESYYADKGSVCYVLPPDEEIHKVMNPTENLSVSIHIYGKPIKEYNIYDPENDEIIRRVCC